MIRFLLLLLMATRFWFPYSEAAGMAPAFDAAWTSNAAAVRRRLTHNKGSSTVTAGAVVALSGAAGFRKVERQYISDCLADQTISGTVKMQMMVLEGSTNNNVDELCLCIRAIKPDGTVRGTLLAVGNYFTAGEFATTFRNKKGADGDAITSTDVFDGDRLAVEVGFGETGTGTSPTAQGKYGENATDLAENETATSGAAWIEFSADIVMQPSRFYFASTTLAPVTPSIFGAWTNTAQAVLRKLNRVKGSSASQGGETIALSGTVGQSYAARQFVSDPIRAGTYGGTVRCQIRCQELVAEDNVDQAWLAIRIFSGDGVSLRGTMLAVGNYGPTLELVVSALTFRNKTLADGDVLAPVTAFDGDRIVVEVGFCCGTSTGITPNARFRFGEPSGDIGVDETTTSDLAPWIDLCVGGIEMLWQDEHFPPCQPPPLFLQRSSQSVSY